MKILYAAANNLNAKIQLTRFIKFVGDKHQIKIAAYKISSPRGMNIDWTLDALLNIYKPELLSLNNDNLNIYFKQVEDFAPDLIISDLEYFTSYVAKELDITLWQCSSSMINFALSKNTKYDLGLFKYHSHSLNRSTIHTQRTINLIDNSNRNFVYSHYGDMKNQLELQPGFEWIRPYHRISKHHIPCQHYITAVLSRPSKKILNEIKKHSDVVVFIDNTQERFENIQIKNIKLEDEYYCNLKNSFVFICQGQSNFLADAFYNGKYANIYPEFDDVESILNSQLAQKLKMGNIVSGSEFLLSEEIISNYSSYIKYLHEHTMETI